MPSKLKKAIGAVKDQTSIGLAKVGGGSTNNSSSTLEVSILKATSHDEAPMDERHVAEILQLIASTKAYAAACAQVISKRVEKTRSWTVALKSLMLVLRVFQDGDPYFPREVLHTMKRGGRILNLSTFRDRSKTKNPWDYTAYVRTFALYLEERLDCFLMGKLQRRFAFRKMRESAADPLSRRSTEPIIREMKPSMLLDRISYWQRLLDRAIATRPTGAAKANPLVQFSLHAIVQESFDLYRDTSDGLALLLDSFFHLQYQSCVNAFQTCVKSSKQFEELSEFYDLCKNMGVGRSSEYPSVQKVSDELVETLREFLKDQTSFPNSNNNSRSPSPNLVHAASPGPNHLRPERFGSSRTEMYCSERGSEYGSQCTSLDDLFSVTDGSSSSSQSLSPSLSLSPGMSVTEPEPDHEMLDRQRQQDDIGEKFPTCSSSGHQGTSQDVDFVSFDDWPEAGLGRDHGPTGPSSVEGPREGWELALGELVTQPPPPNAPVSDCLGSSSAPNNLLGVQQPLPQPMTNSRNNPFLDDDVALTGSELVLFQPATASTSTGLVISQQHQFFPLEGHVFSAAPTFQATAVEPTFKAEIPNENSGLGDDPFLSNFNPRATNDSSNEQQNLQHEQQLWLQQQNKIIAKHMAHTNVCE